MSTPELSEYIRQSRQAGQTDEQIRRALLDVGWNLGDIEMALGGSGNTLPSLKTTTPVPSGIKFIATLGFIGSVLLIVAGFFSLVGGFLFGQTIKTISARVDLFQALGGATTWVFALFGLAMIVFGVLSWIFNRALKRGESWARYLYLLLIGLSIIQVIIRMLTEGSFSGLSSLVIPLIVGAYLLFSRKVKNAFGTILSADGKRRLLIFSSTIIVMLVIIWFGFWQLGKKVGSNIQDSLNRSLPTQTATPVLTQRTALSARQVFGEMKLAGIENNLEKYKSFLSKNTLDELSTQIDAQDLENFSVIKYISEKREGNNAFITVEGDDGIVSDLVFVLEDNVWKYDIGLTITRFFQNASTPSTPAPGQKSDLTAVNILFVRKGEDRADITGIIKNNGQVAVSQLTYEFSINGKGEQGSFPVDLKPGKEFQLDLNHAFANYYNIYYDKSVPKPFVLKLVLKLDPKNTLNELNENNNEITKTFYLQ